MLQNGVPRLPELDLSQSRAGGAADDLDSEPLGGQSSEKADQFALQMALWIDNTYKLSQHQVRTLLCPFAIESRRRTLVNPLTR